MIKVIASDMDGTLLGNNHKIAPQTLEAIHRACDAGIRFMVATGRNLQGVMQELEHEDLCCDYILGSGAEVRDQQKQIVSRIPLEYGLCQEIYEILKEYPVTVIFMTDSYDFQIGISEEIDVGFMRHMQLFFLDMTPEEIKKNEIYQRMRKNTKGITDLGELKEQGISIYKIFLSIDKVDILTQIENRLKQDDRIYVASSFQNNLEITNACAQKGLVLKEYIEFLGYNMEEIMVLGDSMNDYSMMSMDFGATVAMENAVSEIKAVAKYITKSNEALGVAYAIDELLKKMHK